MSETNSVRCAPETQSGDPTPTLARALLVLDAEHHALQTCLDREEPWIDEQWGSTFHLATFGNPKHSGPEFRAELRQLDFSDDLPSAWQSVVDEHGSPERAVQYENAAFARSDLEGGREHLPYILIAPSADPSPRIRVRVPSRLARQVASAANVVDVLKNTISTKFLSDAAKLKDPVRIRARFEQVARQIQRELSTLDSRAPLKQKGGRRVVSDPDEDRRIQEAWDTGQYRDKKELARALSMPLRNVRLAMDRHRKRMKKRASV